MKTYRKSLLSVAAAIAISATVGSAGYIPLTTSTTDNKWVMFGASGFVTTGTVTSTPGVFSVTDSTANTIKDPTADAVAISGLTVSGKDLAELKVVEASSTTAPLEVRVDTTGVAFDATEPMRTMYVDVGGDGTPDFSFKYKASLEGKELQYSVSGGTANTLTIDFKKTFDNPASGTAITGIAAVTGTELTGLSGIGASAGAMDYNLSNNPVSISKFDATTDIDAPAGSASLRVYSFDGPGQKWDVFDSRNTAGTNDIDQLVKAKGYWAKVDNANATEAGMVLQPTALTSADYVTAGLTDGWNLLAFDNTNTEIRYASTGMRLKLIVANNNDTIKIIDASGNHTITVTFPTAAADAATVSKIINSAIDLAKIRGTLPNTIDIKAFGTGVNTIALISNKKFSLQEGLNATISNATSLAGKDLWDEATSALKDYSGSAIPATSVTSVYGEYAMIVKPLTGAGTASALDSGAVMNINVNTAAANATPVYAATDTRVTIATGNTAATTAISGSSADITATEMDLSMDGTLDHVLIASAKQFYIRDNTFSRVYTYTHSAVDGTIKIGTSGTAIANQTIPAAQATATLVAAAIDGTGSGLGAGTPAAETTKIVFTNAYAGGNEFTIAETVGDHLKVSTSTDKMAQGSIQGVISLNGLARKAINNTVDINITDVPDGIGDTIQFKFDTALKSNIAGTVITPNPTLALDSTELTAADNEALLDAYVLQINTDLAAAGITATASHNYTTAGGGVTVSADLNNSVITISGSEVLNVTTELINDVSTTAEVFVVTFDGNETGSDTTIAFDGDTITLAATDDTGIKIATKFKAGYTNTTWTAVDNLDATITFTQNVAGAVADVVAGDFVIAPNTADATAVAVSVAAPSPQGKSASVAENAVVDTASLGAVTDATVADLATDLKYNTVYTPDYVMDGPLFDIKKAGYDLKALVTGTMDFTAGTVSWSSIDLTRPPSEWLTSQDYNLFDTDDRAGYWAYLATNSTTNPITIGTGSLSKNYTHNFDTNGDTFNSYSGNLVVAINGIDYQGTDSAKSARVTASIGGKKIELTRDGTTNNYTGKVSVYETAGVVRDQTPEITIDVSDGLGNNKSQTLALTTFDNVKPVKPSASVSADGIGLTISSTDANSTGGAVSYYVFDGAIPEDGTEAAAIATTTPASPNASSVCANMSAVSFGSPATTLNVIAVDNGGTLVSGNASDAQAVSYMPILKSRIYISDSHSAGTPVATTGGIDYNATCGNVGNLAINTGVTLSTITDGKTSKLAYTSLGEDTGNAVPMSAYFSDGATPAVITKVTYPDTYVGKDVYILIDGKTYEQQLPTRVTAEGSSTVAPIDVSGNVLTSITF